MLKIKRSIILPGILMVFIGTLSVPLIIGHSSEVPQAEFSESIEKSVFVTEDTESTEVSEVVEAKKSGRLISSEISALELHDNTSPVYTMEEANALIENGRDDYYKNGGADLVDVSVYAEKIISSQSDSERNSLENKSFIYHMMLNSVDYFDTAEGSLVYAIDLNAPINTDFSTNIPESYAYESCTFANGDVTDNYVYDGVNYAVTNNETCDISYWSESVEFDINDNLRLITLDDGNPLAINRNDLTNLPLSSSCCLFPQGYAMSRMSDFETWSITGCVELLNKDCAVIEGTFNGGNFVMYVDIIHGSILKYQEYSSDGTMTGYIETTSLEYENPIEKRIFDENFLNK